MKRRPNLFVVGAPKAGSTTMYNTLVQHPDIYMPEDKEMYHFCTDVPKEYREYAEQKTYLAAFKGWKNQKYAGEACPYYLYSKISAKKIHDFNPDAKIIVIIRNPVDSFFSMHNQQAAVGAEPIKDPVKALSAEKLRKSGKLKVPGVWQDRLNYVEQLNYAEQIQRYIKIFGKDNVYITILEEFSKDPRKHTREIFTWLGIDSTFTPKVGVSNARFKIRYHWLYKVSHRPIIWKSVKRVLPKKTYFSLRKAYLNVNQAPIAKKKVDSAIRKRVMKVFRPEAVRLSQLLKKDLLALWGYN